MPWMLRRSDWGGNFGQVRIRDPHELTLFGELIGATTASEIGFLCDCRFDLPSPASVECVYTWTIVH